MGLPADEVFPADTRAAVLTCTCDCLAIFVAKKPAAGETVPAPARSHMVYDLSFPTPTLPTAQIPATPAQPGFTKQQRSRRLAGLLLILALLRISIAMMHSQRLLHRRGNHRSGARKDELLGAGGRRPHRRPSHRPGGLCTGVAAWRTELPTHHRGYRDVYRPRIAELLPHHPRADKGCHGCRFLGGGPDYQGE